MAAGQYAGVAHPKQIAAPVRGGDLVIQVRPWTMGQRAELKPLLLKLLEKLSSLPAEAKSYELATLLAAAEDEIAAIVRATVQRQLAEAGVRWEDLDWPEDLLILSQAVWETSVVRSDGGGFGGKLMRALTGLLGAAARAQAVPSPSTSTSEKPAA